MFVIYYTSLGTISWHFHYHKYGTSNFTTKM
jgi:hypothetical protein